MNLIDFFDRLYIVHLPERVDRYQALKGELAQIGVDIEDPKVILPEPPYPTEAHDFPSIGAYSNFIRHLAILKECLEDNVERVWVLEDDAIFRHQMRRDEEQEKLVQRLSQDDWDLCFIGHNISSRLLPFDESGLVECREDFLGAHCYCANARVLPKLVPYFEETLHHPLGHPRGARLHVDGAFNMFRQLHPEVVTLVSHAQLSSQKGSPSNLAGRAWYDRHSTTQVAASVARSIRDEVWRLGLIA